MRTPCLRALVVPTGIACLLGGLVSVTCRAQAPADTAEASVAGAFRLTLNEARDLALTNNKQLELGRLNLHEKSIAVDAASRDYYPKLLGVASYLRFNNDLGTVLATRDRQIGGATVGPGGAIQLPAITVPGRTISAAVVNEESAFGSVMVAQPITKLIGVSALVDLARADANIAEAQLQKGTGDLLSGVSQAYYGLLGARRIQAALKLQAGMLAALVKMQPSGHLRLQELELRKGIVQVDKQVDELNDLLVQLLGLAPGTVLEPVEPELRPVPVSSAEDAAALALANNPQVREAQQNILKARAGIRAAKMDYLPDVNIVGAYVGQTAADYIQPDFTVVGVTATYTFWDWGKRSKIRRQREVQRALAQRNVDATVDTVALEARKAWQAYKQADDELPIAAEVVQASQQAEGEVSAPLDVLSAKAATATAQLRLMEAEIAHRVAHAKLLAAIGEP